MCVYIYVCLYIYIYIYIHTVLQVDRRHSPVDEPAGDDVRAKEACGARDFE